MIVSYCLEVCYINYWIGPHKIHIVALETTLEPPQFGKSGMGHDNVKARPCQGTVLGCLSLALQTQTRYDQQLNFCTPIHRHKFDSASKKLLLSWLERLPDKGCYCVPCKYCLNQLLSCSLIQLYLLWKTQQDCIRL
jgi:hypothetical protein